MRRRRRRRRVHNIILLLYCITLTWVYVQKLHRETLHVYHVVYYIPAGAVVTQFARCIDTNIIHRNDSSELVRLVCVKRLNYTTIMTRVLNDIRHANNTTQQYYCSAIVKKKTSKFFFL